MEQKQFLTELSNELTKPARKTFPRVKIRNIDSIGHTIGMDLIDLQWVERGNKETGFNNNGNKYILVVEDIYSRYCWLKPLKSKEGRKYLRHSQAFQIYQLKKVVKFGLMKARNFITLTSRSG